ncbi:MAG: 3-isopropylmalate dehydratase small subunit [Spirochaetales bacterium]
MKTFGGKVLFLDRSDINTDEIIPAKYLTEISKEALKPHLLEDLELEGFVPSRDLQGASVLVSRKNFGCGSSREHAPWALEVNGIHVVVASNFARIFRQNMFNCGMLAIELPESTIDELFQIFSATPTTLSVDFTNDTLTFSNQKVKKTYSYSLSPFDKTLVEAGGWVEYADSRY